MPLAFKHQWFWRPVALGLLMATPAVAEVRFAVLVGANAGWSNDRPLRHAESDAERVQQALIEVGQFSADRVLLLRDPDTAELRAQLRRLADRVRAAGDDALVVFYYSGHADERQLHLRGLPFTWDELLGDLRDLPARVRVGLVDACRSGSILSAKGGSPVSTFAVKAEEPVQGMAFLTSSGADELSQETRTLQGSVFTHHFVSGLLGAADTNHDGQVTLDEVYRYSAERTEADTAATLVPQKPAFRYELKGQGQLVMSTLSRATAGVVLPRGPSQRYVVVDTLEWRLVAEGRSQPDAEVMLALKAGDYKLKRVLDQTLEVASLKVASVPVAAASLRFEPQPLSSGLVKGRPDTSNPDELREYRRGEALRLLAQGEAYGARTIFEELLKDKPDDVGAQRGKARALVREAESWDRVGDYNYELLALKNALALEPTLAEDPDFTRWYRRMVELEQQTGRERGVEKAVEKELSENPRLKKRWGVGLEIFGTKGALVLMAEVMVIDRKIFISLGLAPFAPGLDLTVKYVPFGWKVSPWVGVGGFYNLSRLWSTDSTGTVNVNTNGQQTASYNYGEIWSTSAHVDLGVQYFGTLGFHVDAGLGFIFFPRRVTGDPLQTDAGALKWLFLPNISLGWCF